MVMTIFCLFSIFPEAFGSDTLMAFTVTKVEVNIKNINKRKTISVIEDILKLGSNLFLDCMFKAFILILNRFQKNPTQAD